MKKILALLSVIIVAFALCACSSDKDKNADSSLSETETVSGDYIKISTPYSDLKLRKSIAENVSYTETNQNPYTLTFRVKKDGTELFSFVFGGEGDQLVGTIVGEKENTVIYLNVAELDDKATNYSEYATYQMGMNDITSSLLDNKDFVVGEAVEWEPTGTFDIKTSVVTLKYPEKWKEKVNIDVSDKAVNFAFEGVKLFDIYFEEKEDGSQLGTYDKTPIYIVSYQPDEKQLNDEQMEEYSAMQYGINVIVDNLKKDEKFTIA